MDQDSRGKIIPAMVNRVKKYPVITAVAVVIIAAVAIRVGVMNFGSKSVAPVSANAVNIPKVTLLNVSDFRHDDGAVSAKGIVESLQQAELRSQFTGPVTSIRVGMGDTVRAGDTLITLDRKSVV